MPDFVGETTPEYIIPPNAWQGALESSFSYKDGILKWHNIDMDAAGHLRRVGETLADHLGNMNRIKGRKAL